MTAVSVEDLICRGRDVEEEDNLNGAGAAGGHDGAAASAGSHKSLKFVPVGMLEKEVIGGCFLTGEPRTGISMIRGLPAGLKVMVLTVVSFSELRLLDREDRDWSASPSLTLGGPNSTSESRSSSPDSEPSSSLDRYHSWGSRDSLFSSTGILPSRFCSSTMTLSSSRETLFWLLWGSAGGMLLPAAGRLRISPSISLSASRSS